MPDVLTRSVPLIRISAFLFGLLIGFNASTSWATPPSPNIRTSNPEDILRGSGSSAPPPERNCPQGSQQAALALTRTRCNPGETAMCIENPYFDASTSNSNWWHFVSNGGMISELTNFAQNQGASIASACYLCSCPRGATGCFPPEAKILLFDKTEKPIKDLNAGDRVWNPILQQPATITRIVEGGESLALVKLSFPEGSIVVTDKHPMKTDRGVEPANLLTAGRKILLANGQYQELAAVDRLPVRHGQRVWNLSLGDDQNSDHHFLVADKVVTGDYLLQQQLAAKQNIQPEK